MMWSLLLLSFSCVYVLFRKKLLSLLMIELSFVVLIFLFFSFSFNTIMEGSYLPLMVFLGFMVLDSVLGLCCLILSTRSSSPLFSPFSSS